MGERFLDAEEAVCSIHTGPTTVTYSPVPCRAILVLALSLDRVVLKNYYTERKEDKNERNDRIG